MHPGAARYGKAECELAVVYRGGGLQELQRKRNLADESAIPSPLESQTLEAAFRAPSPMHPVTVLSCFDQYWRSFQQSCKRDILMARDRRAWVMATIDHLVS